MKQFSFKVNADSTYDQRIISEPQLLMLICKIEPKLIEYKNLCKILNSKYEQKKKSKTSSSAEYLQTANVQKYPSNSPILATQNYQLLAYPTYYIQQQQKYEQRIIFKVKKEIPRTSKKRSVSELPKRSIELNNLHLMSKTNFPSLVPTQLMQVLTQKNEKNHQLLRERTTIYRQLTDQKGENEGLRKSIKQAMDRVKVQRKQSYVAKDQLFMIGEDKSKLQKEYKTLYIQNQELSQKYHALLKSTQKYQAERQSLLISAKQVKQKLTFNLQKAERELRILTQQNKKLSSIAVDQGLAHQRIKILEAQLRQIKLDKNAYEETISRLNKQLKDSESAIKSTKPQVQKQLERVKYYQRLTSDLQKKAQQFYQKQYQVNKEMQKLVKQMTKTTALKDNFKKLLVEEQHKLNTKTTEFENTTNKLNEIQQQLAQKILKFQQEVRITESLSLKINELQQLLGLKDEEILRQKSRIDFLENHQSSLKTAIEQAKIIAKQSNLFVHKRDMQVYKIKQEKQYLQKKLEQFTSKFKKFDQYYLESSANSKNKLKDSVVNYVRSCSKIEIDMNELKKSLDTKDLQFMQERQMLNNDVRLLEESLPSDPNLHEHVFRQKNDMIRILENSNSQLLKSVTGSEDILHTLQQQNSRYQIQIKQLNRTLNQLRKLQKQNIELKVKEKQQELIIVQKKKQYKELEGRLIKKSDQYNDANSKILKLQKETTKHLAEIESLSTRLNIKSPYKQIILEKQQMPPEKIQQSPKEILFDVKQSAMRDALQKMGNAIKSIQLYFSCGFCQKIVQQPYSAIPCGHNFCQSCRQGFEQDCYQCSNGMPLQGVFKNSNLQSAVPRLKFLCLVFENVSKVFSKNKKESK